MADTISNAAHNSMCTAEGMTGETIQIAARKTPTFKVGKELRDRVNANNGPNT